MSNNPLARFQLPVCENMELKTVAEVININAQGTFFVLAKVSDLHYRVYDACPNRPKGIGCLKKLNDEQLCESCGTKSDQPLAAVLLKVLLQDTQNTKITHNATMFSRTAEIFLQIKANRINDMDPNELARHFETKIGKVIKAKITVKPNMNAVFFAGMDWHINYFILDEKQEQKKRSLPESNEGPSRKFSKLNC